MRCRARKLHQRAAQLAEAAKRLTVDCALARPKAPPGTWVELNDIESAAATVQDYAGLATARLAVFVGGQPQGGNNAGA